MVFGRGLSRGDAAGKCEYAPQLEASLTAVATAFSL